MYYAHIWEVFLRNGMWLSPGENICGTPPNNSTSPLDAYEASTARLHRHAHPSRT